MSNPLLDKYFELYPEKKEPPKMPRIEDYEGEETIITFAGNSSGFICNPNPPSLITYDIDSGKDAFSQIAEKVKNGEAQVVTMNMERDMMSGTKITFEVYVND
jgi:hypothetical protein